MEVGEIITYPCGCTWKVVEVHQNGYSSNPVKKCEACIAQEAVNAANMVKQQAQQKIAELEGKQPRALREVALGVEGSVARLQEIEDAIAVQRAIING